MLSIPRGARITFRQLHELAAENVLDGHPSWRWQGLDVPTLIGLQGFCLTYPDGIPVSLSWPDHELPATVSHVHVHAPAIVYRVRFGPDGTYVWSGVDSASEDGQASWLQWLRSTVQHSWAIPTGLRGKVHVHFDAETDADTVAMGALAITAIALTFTLAVPDDDIFLTLVVPELPPGATTIYEVVTHTVAQLETAAATTSQPQYDIMNALHAAILAEEVTWVTASVAGMDLFHAFASGKIGVCLPSLFDKGAVSSEWESESEAETEAEVAHSHPDLRFHPHSHPDPHPRSFPLYPVKAEFVADLGRQTVTRSERTGA